MIKYIQSLPESPGIILANVAQLWWWRRGRKAVTLNGWQALPQRSAVEYTYRLDTRKNTIPSNRTMAEHVNYIFNHVVEGLCDPISKIDIVGVGEGAVAVAKFLEKEENWKKWSRRLDAFAALATYYHASDNTNKEFAQWLSNVIVPLFWCSGFHQLMYATERPCISRLPGTLRSIHGRSRRHEVDPGS